MTSGRSTAILSISGLSSAAAAADPPDAAVSAAPLAHPAWPRRPAPAEVGAGHLAPARQAAAAARARTERIRAATLALRAGPAADRWEAPAAAPPPVPAMPVEQPVPAEPAAIQRASVDGWAVNPKPAFAAARAPSAGAPAGARRYRGPSVAAAARAATIAFRPLRRPGATAGPDGAAAPAAPPTGRADPAPQVVPAAPPIGYADPASEPMTLAPGGELRRAGATGLADRRRFARTAAELERHLAASGVREPGSNLVPRPTLPLADQDPAGPAWLRLWSRRKAGS